MKRFYVLILVIIYSFNTLAANKRCTDTKQTQTQISLTEDLMREHGILNRILLVYEEIIRRLDQHVDFFMTTFAPLEKDLGIYNLEQFTPVTHEK